MMFKKYVLICDLDDTLTGSEFGIKMFNKLIRSLRDIIYLVYSSGRTKQSILSLIRKEKLVYPNAIISNVGTEIYYSSDWHIDKYWNKKIYGSWRNLKKKVLYSIDGFNLQRQPYKKKCVLSYYIEDEIVVKKIIKTFKKLEVTIIWTKNQYLDIIPENAGKGNAAKFISNKFNLPIVSCGDSENDIDMLKKSEYGILVGNASSSLKNKLANYPNIYISDAQSSEGVIEGLKFYGII